jgi:hypothetical protein
MQEVDESATNQSSERELVSGWRGKTSCNTLATKYCTNTPDRFCSYPLFFYLSSQSELMYFN